MLSKLKEKKRKEKNEMSTTINKRSRKIKEKREKEGSRKKEMIEKEIIWNRKRQRIERIEDKIR